MAENFVCPICGNDDPKYFGKRNGKTYCRKCLTFRGKEADYIKPINKLATYSLSYELSDDQKRLSSQLLENYKNGYNSLVHAVCGSGKTEIVLGIIQYAINIGCKVGFSVPRRDVIIELHDRFSSIFTKNKIGLVYGGHTSNLYGDLVCLTTHQLYRYNHYFDLLIVDEVDAFPYKGNDTLEAFFLRSLKGHYVLMSATPSKQFVEKFIDSGGKVVELFSRFHNHPLPVPSIHIGKSFLVYFVLYKYVKKVKKKNKPLFVFVPTIEMCERTYRFLNFFFKKGLFVHSRCPDRSERIEDFRKGKYWFMVTTAVLERGVTVSDLQVIVFMANHKIYNSYALVQIAGRVGRKKEHPDGSVYYVSTEKTKDMEESIEDIRRANKGLQDMLQKSQQ